MAGAADVMGVRPHTAVAVATATMARPRIRGTGWFGFNRVFPSTREAAGLSILVVDTFVPLFIWPTTLVVVSCLLFRTYRKVYAVWGGKSEAHVGLSEQSLASSRRISASRGLRPRCNAP